MYLVLAYIVLNSGPININWFSGFIIINNWRLFMIVCTIPSIVTGIALFFLPESPKFCFFVNIIYFLFTY